eukprot:CAMPEP_0119409326 /NCGR_PEP_ID=MMETSP1335-20130426/2646_1 /TAXON_ID=259385 /ORGANISM="Chrysoculter rhomboideus, Strain RCC1486" /LENGTH=69 /DNA_ID=CAMNT_0007433691 /DNA_START=126 /DNA_END=335 /DNA_ORIENTATION=-
MSHDDDGPQQEEEELRRTQKLMRSHVCSSSASFGRFKPRTGGTDVHSLNEARFGERLKVDGDQPLKAEE